MRSAEDMAVMVRVAERGGFTAAAEDVGLTPSAVAKLVSRLEQRLGVRLLHRTTRRVTLTAEGEHYVLQARRILADIETFESELAAQGSSPRGLIRVGCGTAVGMDVLLQRLPAFRAQYPDIELDFILADRLVDVVEEQLDIALRLGALTDSSLISRRICTFNRLICAAPAYLEKAPPLEVPEDLLKHECLYVTAVPGLNLWSFRSDTGQKTLEVGGRIRFNMASAVYAACLAGLGIARMSDVLAGRDLLAGRLVPLFMNEHLPHPLDLTALMPAGRQHAPKIRVFLDFLAATFGSTTWYSPR
jgi:DNA-binding transcriptional LysR family regulator